MDVKEFDKLIAEDFRNGAVKDELRRHVKALEPIREVWEKYQKYLKIIYSTPSKDMWQAIQKCVAIMEGK